MERSVLVRKLICKYIYIYIEREGMREWKCKRRGGQVSVSRDGKHKARVTGPIMARYCDQHCLHCTHTLTW